MVFVAQLMHAHLLNGGETVTIQGSGRVRTLTARLLACFSKQERGARQLWKGTELRVSLTCTNTPKDIRDALSRAMDEDPLTAGITPVSLQNFTAWVQSGAKRSNHRWGGALEECALSNILSNPTAPHNLLEHRPLLRGGAGSSGGQGEAKSRQSCDQKT